jgi:nitrogenase molybdenum-iron protein alpha/beta subunit
MDVMGEPDITAPTCDGLPFRWRLNLPYLIGVYLAVNAIRDIWLVVDGPECCHFKGQSIAGKHDWYSTLFRVDGRHRIVLTGTDAQGVTGNREALIERTVAKAMVAEAGAVMLTSMPHCGITGVEYDRILGRLEATTPLLEVPGYSLRGDWLDGYGATLNAIAQRKAFPEPAPRKDAIALVGYLMDRNEGDHQGNLTELARTLGALGFDLVSVWPGGGSWRDLDRVAEAGTIVSLPYGREAARALASKTGARLVETAVPLGIEGTRRWVETIAAFVGEEGRARQFVEKELDRIIPRIERIVPFYFLNRRVGLLCDPHHVAGLAGLCSDLGMQVRYLAAVGREEHASGELAGFMAGRVSVGYDVQRGELMRRGLVDAGLGPGSLVVCNGEYAAHLRKTYAVLELGVPSYSHHVFADAPFLGFEGALQLVNRMANVLSQASTA